MSWLTMNIQRFRPKRIARATYLRAMGCLCLGVAGAGLTCEEDGGGLEQNDQQFVFQVEYVNFAWGLQWTGIVVDRNGVIHAYDHSQGPWEPANADAYTLEELEEKYATDLGVVGTVDSATLDLQFRRAHDVGDSFREPNVVCADAGGVGYTFFRYDPVDKRYVPVILRQEGDLPRENTDADAKRVAAWLRNLALDLDVEGLHPFPDGTCTP
jgi:hypothetical protein